MHSVAQIKQFPRILGSVMRRSKFEDADYLNTMCHEIGTPLTAIIGLSHVLSDIDCNPEKKKEYAEMLRDSSNILMGLMKNMLDSSKIDAGKIEIEEINFDLANIVNKAMHIIATKAAEKALDLQVNIAGVLAAQYIGDPLRIEQILVNLLSNAVKFTEKGHIALNVTAEIDKDETDQLSITIEDTGIGMSEDQLSKIFSKYTQANSSISRKYGGTGLGLSISRDLARLMRGNISVKSLVGMGSGFTLTLPLKRAVALQNAA